jgi:hypothetical protein
MLLLVGVLGCAHPVGKPLRDAVARGAPPPGLVVVYDDRHPWWGGQRITLWGDGALEVLRDRPGPIDARPQVRRGRVPTGEVLSLVDRLVAIRAWEQEAGDPLPAAARAQLPPLDKARVRLTVRVGDASSTAWEWANDVEARQRIVLVRHHLERLVLRARLHRPPGAAGG